jgi:hypothetical protein
MLTAMSKLGGEGFWIKRTQCLQKILEATIVCIASLHCYTTSFWFWKKSAPFLAICPLYLAAVYVGKAEASLSLFPVLVCRHCSLSSLLDRFHDGQIDLTIWETLEEMIFLRLATYFIRQNSGEQHWILASHFACWSRRRCKEDIFWRFYK